MPITYQRLGNSGGGTVDLKITTYPNTEVKLQGDKVARTLISDDQGVAIFKRLKGGTYTVTAKNKAKEIVLVTEYREFLTEQIKDIEIGSKIKFSSGREFILKKHKATAHDQNSATLVSEFIQEDFTWEAQTSNGPFYHNSTKLQTLLTKYFDELSEHEKKCIVNFLADGVEYQGRGTQKIEQRFYLFSLAEFGISDSNFPENATERDLGFPDMDSRIKRYKNGDLGKYWLRNGYLRSDGTRSYWWIGPKGGPNTFNSTASPQTYGIVLGVDISEDAPVYLEADGYYRILGM